MPLTAKGAEAKRDPGMYGDGNGLYLRVGPTGAKSWILRTVIHGKRRELGIGSFDHLTLAEAREKAASLRKVARNGGDPDADRKAEAEAKAKAASRDNLTFEMAMRHVHALLLPGWKNRKHAETWLASLELYAAPKIGTKPIFQIDRNDILEVLAPIWSEKPETAKRLKQRLAVVLDWAIGEGHYLQANPVSQLGLALPAVAKPDAHYAAMPWRDVPAFWERLSARDGMSSLCLRFVILTAARSGEARGARWDEFDFDSATWTVPGERMKAGRLHRVPLTPEAIEILQAVKGLDPIFVFPSPQREKDGSGKAPTDMIFKRLFLRMGVDGFTVHGFRSSFRDWCTESAHADPELAEAALAHVTGNAVARAYARSDLFERRRKLMEGWASFVTGRTGTVVRLARA